MPDYLLTLRAWAVHLYTSLGLACGFLALLAVVNNQPLPAAIYLGLAGLIDGTDGVFARRFNVHKWTPHFDGRKLDDIVDYVNYVFVPIYAAYQFKLVADEWGWVLPFVLIAAAYGFANETAKTNDGYFTGFPNYWNCLVFYLYLLQTPPWLNGALFLFFGILVFVPIKYIYPTQTIPFRRLTLALTILWLLTLLPLLFNFYQPDRNLLLFSLTYPAYYFGLSFYLHFRARKSLF